MSFAHAASAPEPRFPQPPAGHRDWYAFEAIRALPRILLMVDKNPLSPTYGCFDREFWHYRTVDFPCGMSQEFVLPLALLYRHNLPNNPYYGLERLRELAVAGIEYARASSHADGSCDDYFPFERALGALVFSTYAMTEAYMELGLQRPDLVDFFRLRGDWLRTHNETGQLANHQAFAALALYNIYQITGDDAYRRASDDFCKLCLSWQHEEGWFQEYEGADPGYHTCTIAFLAKLYQKSKDPELLGPLRRAVEFAAYFMHPDGSYGGEYGSRNTYHFYPHGFEVMSPHCPAAGQIAKTYLQRALPERRRYFNDDNRMCAHYVYDWIHAWLDHDGAPRPTLEEARPAAFQRYFAGAKLLIKKTPAYYAVASLAKGGVIKVFDDQGPLYSDTGVMLRAESGATLVSHMVDDAHQIDVESLSQGRVSVTGPMSRRKHQLSSPVKQIAFRTMNLSVGRYSANLVRSALQKVLITGKPRADVSFTRHLVFTDDTIELHDRVDASRVADRFERMLVGSDATSIYVANSNTFQESVLLPWVDQRDHVPALNDARVVDLPPRIVRARAAKADA
jgi:hypothetical protein